MNQAHPPFALTRHLLASGYSEADLRRLSQSNELTHLCHGAWTQPEHLTDDHHGVTHHRLRVLATLSRMGGDVAASHVSAAVLLGLDLWHAPLQRVHLSRTGGQLAWTGRHCTIHERRDAVLGCVDGVACVSAADAVVGTGLVSARRSPLEFLIAGDSALHRGLTTLPLIDSAMECQSGARGMASLRALRPHLDARHESAAETRLAHDLRQLQIESTPQVEQWVHGVQYFIDRVLDDARVAIEVDGLAKYGSSDAEVRAALTREKRREDDLRSVGYGVVRVTWDLLGNPQALLQRIQAARALASR